MTPDTICITTISTSFFCDPLSPLSNAFIIVQRNGWLMIQRMAFSCMNCFRNIFQNWHKDFYGILFECCCGFWALIKASFPFRNRMLREILAKMYTSEIFFWHSGLIKEPVLISHINFTFFASLFLDYCLYCWNSTNTFQC